MHVCACACLRLMHGVPNEVCLFNSWSFTMPSECVCASFFSRLLLCVKGLNVVKYTKSCFCLFIYINISSFFFWFLFKLHARCICLPFFQKISEVCACNSFSEVWRKRRSNESRNQIYINQCFYSRILDLFIFAVFLLAQNKSKSIWIMGPWRGKEIWLLKLPKLMIHKKACGGMKKPSITD